MKILILSIYPAPYRKNLFDYFSEDNTVDVFFEKSSGDKRKSEWFVKGKFYLLDTDDGANQYKKCLSNLKDYDLVALYDFTTKESIKLIMRCQLLGIPYVVNCDGVMLIEHGNIFRDLIKKLLVRKASACLASGEYAKEYFVKYGASDDKIFIHTFSTLENDDIIDKPLDCNEKNNLRKELNLPTDKKIAIAVGRFIPLKRYSELIEEWGNLDDNCLLLLIGGGEEHQKYKEIIDSHHIKNVIIQDYHPFDTLLQYYKASDVFVHPTSYDVWGLVVNEALACGLPVVVSDKCIAGLELISNGQNGFIVEMGNEHELCNKAEMIMKNTQMQNMMAWNAIDTIKEYTILNMANKHLEIFKQILF